MTNRSGTLPPSWRHGSTTVTGSLTSSEIITLGTIGLALKTYGHGSEWSEQVVAWVGQAVVRSRLLDREPAPDAHTSEKSSLPSTSQNRAFLRRWWDSLQGTQDPL